MKIGEKKFIYCPQGEHGYDFNTFMTPHAALWNMNTIRIWGGVRDRDGISRIIYIDVDAEHPDIVKKIADRPVLDIGKSGNFDDNGVILGDIIDADSTANPDENTRHLYMYYVGFQHVQNIKFYAFSGVAESFDGGVSFKRISQVPCMDRTDTGRYGRCIHTVIHDEHVFRCYYAVINEWKVINDIPYPVYDIWYTESDDGIHFPNEDTQLCISTRGNEYRIGRPKVYRTENGYEMLYTRDFVTKEYVIGYAKSDDGINWDRDDEAFPLRKSGSGFDSNEASYPVLLDTSYGTYIFYNGNGMGKTGFGYAKLERN